MFSNKKKAHLAIVLVLLWAIEYIACFNLLFIPFEKSEAK